MYKLLKLTFLASASSLIIANAGLANEIVFRYNPKVVSVQSMAISNFSPADQYVGENMHVAASVTGGIAPHLWSATGNLPTGISFSDNGILSGTPTVAGEFGNLSFKATDSVGDAVTRGPERIVIYNQLSGAELFDSLAVDVAQSKTIPVSGGKAPLSFTVVSGSLPQGMSISDGTITGTPTAVGLSTATILARDANGRTAQVDVNLDVRSRLVAVADFSEAYVGENYEGRFSAVGGSNIYTWMIGSGSLPSGLTLSETSGLVSGRLDEAGDYNFTGSVSDGYTFESAAVSLKAYHLPQISSKSYNDPYVGTAYSNANGAAPIVSGGKAPLTWSASGLPSGLAINATNGQITGTPTAAGSTNAIISIVDANQRSASKTVSFASRAALALTNEIPSLVKMTEAVNVVAVGSGGLAPYTYTATGLPTGLGINASTGAISGTPTVTGNFDTNITMVDANGKSVSASKSIVSEEGMIVATMSGGNGATTLKSHFSESDWVSATPKILTLPAGQVRGVQTGQNVVTVGGAWGGTLTFNVAGEIQGTAGYGGAGGPDAQGGNGGNALYVETAGASGQKLVLNVTGAIRAGGGGGGIGGWGGQGGQGISNSGERYQYSTMPQTYWSEQTFDGSTWVASICWELPPGPDTYWCNVASPFTGVMGSPYAAPDGYTYHRGTYHGDMNGARYYAVSRSGGAAVAGGAGGAGGNGGYGQGYGTAAAGGLAGAGGTAVNGAGTGGAGGNGGSGGSWGVAGVAGTQGGGGTNGGAGGNAGAIGGQPGYAIVGNGNVNRSGGGVVNGPTQ